MTLCLRLSERPLDQGITDAALAKRRLDRERSEQQRLGVANANRRKPYRADQQRADARGKRQLRPVPHALAQPVRRFGVAARTERALVQMLDRHRVVGRLRQDGEREVGHSPKPARLALGRRKVHRRAPGRRSREEVQAPAPMIR